MTIKTDLIQRLNDRTAVVAVLGLGYVGLPLAVTFAAAGFKVLCSPYRTTRVAANKYLLMLGRALPFGPHHIRPSLSSSRSFSSEIRQKRPGGGENSLPVAPTIEY